MASQTVIGLGAAGLGFAVAWHDRDVYAAGLKGSSAVNPASYRSSLVRLGEIVLGVVVITAVAGVSPQWAGVMGVLLVILWLLWLMESVGGKKWVAGQTAKKGAK